jgi:hypothetical protein
MVKESKIEILIEIVKYSFASIGFFSCTKFLVNFLKKYQQNKIDCTILLEDIKETELKNVEKLVPLTSLANSEVLESIKDKVEFLEKRMAHIDFVNERLTTLQVILGDLREKISSR